MTVPLNRIETMALGIVVERRRGATPWADWSWRPVSVIPGAGPVEPPGRLLMEGEGWSRSHAATLTLELFRSDTEGYRLNLSQDPPRLWVVMRPGADGEALEPCVVTASAHEGEGYQVGTDVVDTVPMPPEVIALVRDFVEQHHVDVPFQKRERTRHFEKEDRRP
ncbi:DUF3305 domain-containing protein [Azospirillum picis]|uniref:DUF3305 domain-containing protein n=1 Tax=Azospirillum picis TaxID=488438 RepID=A0ABU0MF37_9PROT|nr:DUF3305 domain-containing protein [Azospirillum picis]MBP2298205.1 hypothetical protein [Azospirillum picis]MDQ0532043.1 hypothetical protein [Azospirillum picis]